MWCICRTGVDVFVYLCVCGVKRETNKHWCPALGRECAVRGLRLTRDGVLCVSVERRLGDGVGEQQWCRVYFARAAYGAAVLATTNTLTDTRGSQTGFRATATEQGRCVAWWLARGAARVGADSCAGARVGSCLPPPRARVPVHRAADTRHGVLPPDHVRPELWASAHAITLR